MGEEVRGLRGQDVCGGVLTYMYKANNKRLMSSKVINI